MSVREIVTWQFYDYNQNLWLSGEPSVHAVWIDAEHWLRARVVTPEADLVSMSQDPLSLAITLIVSCSPETADWLYAHGQA